MSDWKSDFAQELSAINAPEMQVSPTKQRERDNDALRILQAEWQKDLSDSDRAALAREIKSVSRGAIDYTKEAPSPAPESAVVVDWKSDFAQELSSLGTDLPEGVRPSTAGGGRGGQGGARAGEIEAYKKAQNAAKPMLTSPLVQGAKDFLTGGSARAAAIGAGQGYTAGLVKYPVAAAAMVADKLRNPKARDPLTWEAAKKLYTEEVNQTAADNPLAYGAGAAGGAIASPVGRLPLGKVPVPGGRAVTKPLGGFGTGAAVARGAGSGAVYGGVSGYTANDDLGEAGKGAALGGTIGGVIPGVAGSVQKLADSRTMERVLAPIETALKGKTASSIKELRALMEPQIGPELAKTIPAKELREWATSFVQNTRKDPMSISKWGLADDTVKARMGQALKDQAIASSIGAIGSAAAAPFYGADPVNAALGGAIAGPGLRAITRGGNSPLADYAATKMTQTGAGLPYRGYLSNTAKAAQAGIPSIMPTRDPNESFASKSGVQLTPDSLKRSAPQTVQEANSSLMDLLN